MSGITRTQDVTVADAWANDDGGVSLEIEGHIVPVTPEEAIVFALAVYAAAVDAAQAVDDKTDAEMAIEQLEGRALITHWDPYAEARLLPPVDLGGVVRAPDRFSWGAPL